MSLCEDTSDGNTLEVEQPNRRTYSTGAYAKNALLKNLERRLSIQSIGRRFSKDSNAPVDTGLRFTKDDSYTEEIIETLRGSVTVAWKGNRSKTALVTYHDLGLNHISNFKSFFDEADMGELLPNFCVYHINAPGQEFGAEKLPEGFVYPSMDDLCDQVNEVLNHFGIVRYVGIGVGFGGNVLARHSFKYPDRVDSLMLINTIVTPAGWFEWGYNKRNVRHMTQIGMTPEVIDYLIWHHLGPRAKERNAALRATFKTYFSFQIQPSNLAKLIEQYNLRSAIEIKRDQNTLQRGQTYTLKVPVLNVVGSQSAFVDDTVALNGKLDPAKTLWLNVQDAGMVLEEQPEKVIEALVLFLQGQGHCLRVRQPSVSLND